MNRELLQQALDALTHHRQQTTFQFCETNSAIKALEQELAKPEQDHGFDRTTSHMVGEYVDTAQSDNQEPVAPPRKPWVALTHADLMKEFGYTDELLRNTAYGVEKIIKDKNT
jgi:hypothetical protein